MSDIDVPPLPKLPLGTTISLSYAWFFQKFADVLRISWLWLVLCTVVIGVVNWMQMAWFAAMLSNIPKEAAHFVPPVRPFGFFWFSLVLYAVVTLGTVSIAVAWHRRIILDERPGLSGSNIATGPVWRYLGIGFVLGLLFFLPLIVILVPGLLLFGPSPGQQPNGTFFLLMPIVFILYIVSLAILLRLIVLLPARAIGDVGLTFGQAWRRTRGNIWRMFWGLVACVVPPIIALQIVFVVVMTTVGWPRMLPGAPGAFPVLGLTLMNTLLYVLHILTVPIYLGFLSHSYRHFFQGGIEPAG